MPKSRFFLALLRDQSSDWQPPVRPPSSPPPRVVKYDPETTPAAGAVEVGRVLLGVATDLTQDEHWQRVQAVATQVGALLPQGTSLIMVPDQAPAVGWGVSPSYSLYPPDTEFFSSDGGVERIQISGSGPSGTVSGTSIPSFSPPPDAAIPGQFTVNTPGGEQVIVNIPDYTARNLEERGITVRELDIQQEEEIPADARFDARDRESPRDFDVGREPGGEDHERDYQGDIRPGGEWA
jgi:hypothetical protein